MNNEILDYLERAHGITSPREYYARIDEWGAWMKGHLRSFHEFYENGNGGFPIKRRLYSLNMAKKICEDWASLIMGEKTYIKASDSKSDEWLGGSDGQHGFIGETGLLRGMTRMIEKVFGLGSGAALLRLDGVKLRDGRLTGDGNTKLRVDFVDAAHIVPISTQGGRITEAAFISEARKDGCDTVYVELHRLEEDGYVITNEWLCMKNGELEAVPPKRGVASVVRTGSFVPLFAVLTPCITNYIDELSGLGVSVFAQATDCLRGVDLAFNNFCRDLKLGGKKVFVNRSLVMRGEDGVTYTPDDVAQQLFVTVGDGDIDGETMIKEHNPSLRAEENAVAVQHQLDYLSFRCGLGTRHYLFSGVQGKAQLTATQYTGEMQDLIQNTARHRVNVTEFLVSIIRAALWAGKHVIGAELDEDCEVSVRFDDSYFIDSESERTRDRAEVEAGLMKPFEFRMKWRGESEEMARLMTGEDK
ncbi:MAG: hypothetical protein IKM46_06820 [Clostridia bacterium]|nr:hypothetical protein [Clostridia bacterium]